MGGGAIRCDRFDVARGDLRLPAGVSLGRVDPGFGLFATYVAPTKPACGAIRVIGQARFDGVWGDPTRSLRWGVRRSDTLASMGCGAICACLPASRQGTLNRALGFSRLASLLHNPASGAICANGQARFDGVWGDPTRTLRWGAGRFAPACRRLVGRVDPGFGLFATYVAPAQPGVGAIGAIGRARLDGVCVDPTRPLRGLTGNRVTRASSAPRAGRARRRDG
jgi:hypothetical protein